MADASGVGMRSGLVFVMVAGAVGCATPDAPTAFEVARTGGASKERAASQQDDDSKDDEARGSRPSSTEATDTSGVTPTVPRSITVWKGRVDATPPTDFGGGKWCNYAVALSNIDLAVTLDAKGNITSTDLSNVMTETSPSCASPPLGTQQNKYAYRQLGESVASDNVVQLPDPTNLPLANVAISVVRIDDTHVNATLVFQRIGGVEDALNWSVTTSVDLTPPGM